LNALVARIDANHAAVWQELRALEKKIDAVAAEVRAQSPEAQERKRQREWDLRLYAPDVSRLTPEQRDALERMSGKAA